MKQVQSFIQYINEGLYDKGIFKAFFLAGGPGSGKTFVTHSVFAGSGLKVVNSDNVFERSLKQAGLSLSMPDTEKTERDILRAKSKVVASNIFQTYIIGRLGMIIDGTARDYDAIARQYQLLSILGYDCYMVFVDTDLNVALERQKGRERKIPEYIVTTSWKTIQSNKTKYQRLFGMNFHNVENNKSNLELVMMIMGRVSKLVRRLISLPIKSFAAKRWIVNRMKEKRSGSKYKFWPLSKGVA